MISITPGHRHLVNDAAKDVAPAIYNTFFKVTQSPPGRFPHTADQNNPAHMLSHHEDVGKAEIWRAVQNDAVIMFFKKTYQIAEALRCQQLYRVGWNRSGRNKMKAWITVADD